MKKNYVKTTLLALLYTVVFTAQTDLAPVSSGNVAEGFPNSSNWDAANLDVKVVGTSQGFGRIGYLNFDISSLNTVTLSSANIRLYLKRNTDEDMVTGDRVITVNAYTDGPAGTNMPIPASNYNNYLNGDIAAGRDFTAAVSSYTIPSGASGHALTDTWIEFDVLNYINNTLKPAGITEVAFELVVTAEPGETNPRETLYRFDGGAGTNTPTLTYEGTALSLNDFMFSSLRLYPNPTKGSLYVSNENSIDEAKLYTVTGNLVYSIQINRKEFKINTKNLSTGLYLLKLIDKQNASITKRVLVE